MLLDQLLAKTIAYQASDLHLLINQQTTLAQWRIAGELSKSETLNHGEVLANRIKIVAQLNVAETRRIQEGQFNFQYHNKAYCIRVSVMRSDSGESLPYACLRLQSNAN